LYVSIEPLNDDAESGIDVNRAFKFIRQNELLFAVAREVRDIYSYIEGTRRGTFSQHGEDTFIQARFGNKKEGFYVDVGASHPFRLSNTFLLYKSGWRGVTVEPIPLLGRLHRRWRPQDIFVQKAIGPVPCKLRFYEMLPSVLSTLDPKTAKASELEDKAQLLRSYEIDVITLGQLFADYVGERIVDLLSVDIEGLDADTITTFELHTIRPRVICIEANHIDCRNRILTYLEHYNYRPVAELGVNLIFENALE
jgi:FkbM family methyltransferase